MTKNNIYLGNNIDLLKEIEDNSIGAIITDSPYGLGKPPDVIKTLSAWPD